jgi:hypothetical protein
MRGWPSRGGRGPATRKSGKASGAGEPTPSSAYRRGAVQAFAEAHGQLDQLDNYGRRIHETIAADARLLSTSGIANTLRAMTYPARIASDNRFYADLVEIGSGDEQPGAALKSAREERNDEMCARLVQLVARGDRVVVVYGAGHAFLLRQCVAQMPGFEPVEAGDYLPAEQWRQPSRVQRRVAGDRSLRKGVRFRPRADIAPNDSAASLRSARQSSGLRPGRRPRQ